MKALVCCMPGKFEYVEKAFPSPAPAEVIIKIKRVGICGTDLHAYKGTQPYFNYPRILGHELSGDVVDANGNDFVEGTPVTIIPYFNCGICIACRNNLPNCCSNIKVCGVHIDGAMTEYLSVPSYSLLQHPGLDYDTLSITEPLAIGAHGVRRANVQPGEFVLVVGAGPIGLGAMQFAAIAGATVIALDINDARLEIAKRKFNIPFTINASSDNVQEQLLAITNGDMPTVVIEATGNLQAINKGLMYLAHGGRYVLIGLQKEEMCFSHPEFHKRETTLMSSRNATRKDFEYVISCIEKKLVDPSAYITHRVHFPDLKNAFEEWLSPSNNIIKAMVDFN